MNFLGLRLARAVVIASLSGVTLSACGGGGGEASARATSPVGPGLKQVIPIGAAITDIKIDNTSTAAQTDVPVTFGQVFAEGDLSPSDSVAGKLNDGSAIPVQVDVKATHADGSLRHAVISAVVPGLRSSQTQTIQLTKAVKDSSSNAGKAPADLVAAGFTASVNITVGGQSYSASADALLKAGNYTTWLAGPIANEWLVSAPLKTAGGVEHPHLTARFAIRSYTGVNKAKVDVTIENDWAYEPSPQNFTYDMQVVVGGQTVYSKAALTHYHHARWRKSFWWGTAPQAHVRHNTAYLIASKAVPSYDTGVVVSETGLNSLNSRWTTGKTGPMEPGIVVPTMGMGGGRPDIGPLPQWAAMYLLSMDRRAKDITLGTGDLAGSWPIHYRDKKTDRPVSLVDYPYMTLWGNPGDAVNPVTGKSELFPTCGGDCSTTPYTYAPDSSHQPSMAYMPYLITGDYYYLEELHFWTNWNLLQANPYYRGFEKGLVKFDQVRGQAWSLRTLGHAAYITPDSHPMKQYFVTRVRNNLDWYNATYAQANLNQLGVIDGTGQGMGQAASGAIVYKTSAGAETGVAPWQDDFFTWSAGHLVELGFDSAKPLLQWKAKFPVGRMTAPGYCWIDGSTYSLTVRPSSTSPLYSSFSEAYMATMRNDDGTPMTNSTGARYLDQPCGSQAQANWRTQKDKDDNAVRSPWSAGEMVGYAYSTEGYPANMQPALAVAATSGIPNAEAAWDTFMKRAVKPNYGDEPNWAIVPRN
jgi:hypothetical protein